MNGNQVKSVIKNAQGIVKEELGHALGNIPMEISGVKDQLIGKCASKLGEATDVIKKKVDTFLAKK
jgi:uncharacterized protein YjbJ (UPF0337 family)